MVLKCLSVCLKVDRLDNQDNCKLKSINLLCFFLRGGGGVEVEGQPCLKRPNPHLGLRLQLNEKVSGPPGGLVQPPGRLWLQDSQIGHLVYLVVLRKSSI